MCDKNCFNWIAILQGLSLIWLIFLFCVASYKIIQYRENPDIEIKKVQYAKENWFDKQIEESIKKTSKAETTKITTTNSMKLSCALWKNKTTTFDEKIPKRLISVSSYVSIYEIFPRTYLNCISLVKNVEGTSVSCIISDVAAGTLNSTSFIGTSCSTENLLTNSTYIANEIWCPNSNEISGTLANGQVAMGYGFGILEESFCMEVEK